MPDILPNRSIVKGDCPSCRGDLRVDKSYRFGKWVRYWLTCLSCGTEWEDNVDIGTRHKVKSS